MNPFEPLKYEKPLQGLKSRISKEGSKSVFSPLIEKFILNNPHKVTVEMQVRYYIGLKTCVSVKAIFHPIYVGLY